VAPRAPGRNEPCHCGSRRKYKRCCLERDAAAARQRQGAGLPPWILQSRGKLQQFVKYACEVYELPLLLRRLTDRRRDPEIRTFDVVNSLFQAALLRLPSINALEGDLKEADFQMLIGRRPKQDVKVFSAEVVYNVLDKLHHGNLRHGIEDVVWMAERNKAFREGFYGTLRDVAIDGWEPFASFDRHCEFCLERKVKVKNPISGEVEKRIQYYHSYVVAMLLGPVLDVVLDIEEVRNDEARRDVGEDAHHEGELTAALRLVDRLHATYRSFPDAFVFDALYANGPVMTKLAEYNYGGFIVLKKENNEPFQEALDLWGDQPPCEQYDDPETKEHIEFWDVDEIDTLSTFKGKTRVIRALVSDEEGKTTTWCFAIVGKRARKIGRRAALKTVRARWHIENTAFNQWVQYWNLAHVYHHTPNAILAVLLLWTLVFNLLQLFVYRRLRRLRDPLDPTDTIRHIVEVMLRNVGSIPTPIPWVELADTS
jgi:hypothetical protein